jgi:hypothetical protein
MNDAAIIGAGIAGIAFALLATLVVAFAALFVYGVLVNFVEIFHVAHELLNLVFPPAPTPSPSGIRFRLADILVAVIFHATMLGLLARFSLDISSFACASVVLLCLVVLGFAITVNELEQTARRYSPLNRALVLAGCLASLTLFFPLAFPAWAFWRENDAL